MHKKRASELFKWMKREFIYLFPVFCTQSRDLDHFQPTRFYVLVGKPYFSLSSLLSQHFNICSSCTVIQVFPFGMYIFPTFPFLFSFFVLFCFFFDISFVFIFYSISSPKRYLSASLPPVGTVES
jgi:hypothetical protein